MRIKIPDFPDYVIDEHGRIFGPQGRQKAARKGANGYWRVNLSRSISGKRRKQVVEVHLCMARAWHGPKPCGYHAAHRDDDPDNNTRENICWMSPSENNRMRRKPFRVVADHVSQAQIIQLRSNGWTWGKISEASGIPERSLRRAFARPSTG